MALLDRVATLIRANLNDLIDKAEDPEKMLKQLVLDIQNQLLQVKTQLAMAIADHHLLLKKQQENEATAANWIRKAEFAMEKKQEDLARAALEKSVTFRRAGESFAQQVEDQHHQVEALKNALLQLQVKLAETQTHAEVAIAQHRRSKAFRKAADARWKVASLDNAGTLGRMQSRVQRNEAVGQARNEMVAQTLEDRIAALERDEEVEKLLAELRDRKAQKPA